MPHEPLSPRVESSPAPAFSPFHWGLLAGLAAFQLAYLAGLALCVRWALHRLIGA